jgi:hypothetical protein
MPITQAEVEALKKFIGQGEIYLNVTKPNDMTALTLNAQGIPTGGTSVGLTNGPASLEYKPEFKGLEVEQAFGELAPRLTKETVTLKFKCAEATYDRIQAALPMSTLEQDTTATGIADPVTAPTLAHAAASTALAAGDYHVAYAYITANGVTLPSPDATVTLVAGDNITTTDLGILPGGVTGVIWYLSVAANSATMKQIAQAADGAAQTFTTLPAAGAASPQTVNTTGGANRNLLMVGGKIDAITQCVALVSKIGTYSYMGTTVVLYEWVCVYEAMSVDGVKLDWKRGENRMVEITITGYADVTRSEGDQLYQLGQLAQPA